MMYIGKGRRVLTVFLMAAMLVSVIAVGVPYRDTASAEGGGYSPIVIAGIELPYSNVTTRSIWVSTVGNDDASGTKDDPLRTIQAAVGKATPGTAIMVKEGTYDGSVILDGVHGTPEAPILLISADGIGRAIIDGPTNNAAIKGNRLSNVGIYGFNIHPNVPLDRSDPDVGGLKLFSGAFTNSTEYPTADAAQNLVIAGNIISGTGRDGLKVFGGAMNNLIIANNFVGQWYEEAIDMPSVETTKVAYNTVGGKAGYTGITMKHGSQDIEVFRNVFNIEAGRGINIGGQGHYSFEYPDHWKGFMAKNINAHHNIVYLQSSAYFEGANNSTLAYNYLAGRIGSRPYTDTFSDPPYTYHSYDNEILNNNVTREDFYITEAEDPSQEYDGYIFGGNIVSEEKPYAGSDTPEARLFMSIVSEVAPYVTVNKLTSDSIGYVELRIADSGVRNELISKLNNVKNLSGEGYEVAAISELNAFVGYVNAQEGTGLTYEQANTLREAAKAIEHKINFPSVIVPDGTLLTDDFEDGNSDGWDLIGQSWSVVADADGNKILSKTINKSEAFAIAGEDTWSNYIYQAKFRLDYRNGAIGPVFRYSDVNNYYLFRINDFNDKWELVKKSNGTITVVESGNFTPVLGQWYTMNVRVVENSIKGYIDGVQMFDWTNPVTELTFGKIGMRTFDTSAMDDVLVGPIPSEPGQDVTPPVTESQIAGQQNNGVYTSDVTVTLTATDEGSGVDKTEYSMDGGETWETYTQPIVLTADGTYNIKYRSIDKAGNIEEERAEALAIDKTVPVFSLIVNGMPLEEGSVFEDYQPLSFVIEVEDNLSGIATSSIVVDGEPYQPGTQMDFAGELGQHSIAIAVEDKAGNRAEASYTFEVITGIDLMQGLLERYKASGEIKNPLFMQLSNDLKQAEFFMDKVEQKLAEANLKMAVKHMEDFKKHLNNKAMSKFVSEGAKAVLNTDADALIEAWTK